MLHLLSNDNISGRRTLEARHRSVEKVEVAGNQQANDGELSEEESMTSATDEISNSRPTGSGCVAYHFRYYLRFKCEYNGVIFTL